MTDKSPFEMQVQAVSEALNAMLKAHKEKGIDSSKWLEALFKHYSDRMLSDNERIWGTGTLFVPISLAAFVALAGIKSLQLWHIIALGAPS